MKRTVIIVLTLLLVVLLIPSCENDKATGSLRVIFGDEKTRTIAPETTYSETLDSYEVELTMPSGEIYRAKNIKSGTLNLKSLPIGDYTLMVLGFSNESEEYKAKGVINFRLYADENSVTVPLHFRGKGSLNLNFNFDKSKLDPTKQVDLLFEFYNEKMEKIVIDIDSSNITENAINTKFRDIQAGAYTVKIFLRNARVPIASIVELVKIVPNTETIGNLTFEIGEKVDSLDVAIKPIDTNVPISGRIVEKTKDSDSYTYRVDITEKPDYLKNENIKLIWFVNGVEKGNSDELTVLKSDATRGKASVAVVISSNMDGIMGSASTIANFSSTFAESNSGFVKE